MQLNDFNFVLPEELIAQYPLKERSASRLLHLEKSSGKVTHRNFVDLSNLLQPNDLLIFNDTRVMPARLYGKKNSGGKVEILVERILANNNILAHVKPSKSLKINQVLQLANNYSIEILTRHNDLWELKFLSAQPVLEILNKIGHMPLPPYIDRADEQLDEERYQTVYAKNPGAIAAPTAGLHFDDSLLQKIQQQKINIGYVTLHVGAGTFQPVRVDNIVEHKMHAEYFSVTEKLCQQINDCKKQGGRVIAVGTTVVRSLETIAAANSLQPYQGETKIFIYPGYQFRCVDAMITNFHLPKSTLLMLVAAFAGHEKIINAYNAAITERYRFFSYGDAMFIA